MSLMEDLNLTEDQMWDHINDLRFQIKALQSQQQEHEEQVRGLIECLENHNTGLAWLQQKDRALSAYRDKQKKGAV